MSEIQVSKIARPLRVIPLVVYLAQFLQNPRFLSEATILTKALYILSVLPLLRLALKKDGLVGQSFPWLFLMTWSVLGFSKLSMNTASDYDTDSVFGFFQWATQFIPSWPYFHFSSGTNLIANNMSTLVFLIIPYLFAIAAIESSDELEPKPATIFIFGLIALAIMFFTVLGFAILVWVADILFSGGPVKSPTRWFIFIRR